MKFVCVIGYLFGLFRAFSSEWFTCTICFLCLILCLAVCAQMQALDIVKT